MQTRRDPDTNELLERVRHGDRAARQELLLRHRKRLRQMVALRLDRRLLARVDPSDVVQEALIEAAARLSDYARQRPLPFYPWLRQLAWDRLLGLYRRHLYAQKRSVRLEEPGVLDLPEDSAVQLASRLAADTDNPSRRLLRKEARARIQEALAQLAPRDREVLVLRHLEYLSASETAAVLGLKEEAVKSRHRRALERLRILLEGMAEDDL